MPCCNTAKYKSLQRVLRRQCSYTTHATKQRTWLCRRFSGDLPYFDAVVWMVHQAMLRHLRHAGAYNSACTAYTDTRIPSPRRDAVQLSTADYYKRYIRARPLLWLHARQCSISKTMPARRGLLPLCADRWQVLRPAHRLAPFTRRVGPVAGTRRSARNH